MRRSAIAITVLVAGGLLMPGFGNRSGFAAEKRVEYKSPGSIKKILLKGPVHGLKDEQVTFLHVTFPPGWVGGQHYHTGPVYVYVLKGEFVVHEKGKEPQRITAGQLYHEPVGNPMEARNASTSEPTEALVMQLGHNGEPLMVQTHF